MLLLYNDWQIGVKVIAPEEVWGHVSLCVVFIWRDCL